MTTRSDYVLEVLATLCVYVMLVKLLLQCASVYLIKMPTSKTVFIYWFKIYNTVNDEILADFIP